MALLFSNSPPQPSEAELAAVERLLRSPLPPEYRAFLQSQNGGTPTPDNFLIPGEGKLPQRYYVNRFLSVKFPETETDLVGYYRFFVRERGILPAHLLPIADDYGGDLYCLSLSASDYGKVYYLDHEETDDTGRPALTLIAESFDRLLAFSESPS